MLANSSSTALIIFVKNPIPGNVKTRLGAEIGMVESSEVYKKLLAYSKELTLKLDVNRYVYYGDFINEDDLWSSTQFAKRKQVQEDLGSRMYSAISECLEHHEKVILIGTDCPDLSEEILNDAIKCLNRKDVVIGPAIDGGYYLIGMKDNHRNLFSEIEWSTESVYKNTIANIEINGLSYGTTKELSDIDYKEDWDRVKSRFEDK